MHRTISFLDKLNELESWGTDIGNSCLEELTKEKVQFKAGQDFGCLQGHPLIINNDLCGLIISGLRWKERLSKFLRDMTFGLCNMEIDTWLKDCGKYYECIVVHVDDLLIASKYPQGAANTLIKSIISNFRKPTLFLTI